MNKKALHTVLSDVKTGNVSENHCESIDVLRVARQEQVISSERPQVLLHFDTHSDLRKFVLPPEKVRLLSQVEPDSLREFETSLGIKIPETIADDEVLIANKVSVPNKITIANWINLAVVENNITDIYWILPDWTKEDPYKKSFWEDHPNITEHARRLANFADGPTEQRFYVNPHTEEVFFTPPIENASMYREVRFYKLCLSDLPSLPDEADVILDICGDYFVNSGYDTIDDLSNVPHTLNKSALEITQETKRKANAAFNAIFETLAEKSIKPVVYMAAESKAFVPSGYRHFVNYMLLEALRHAANGTLKNTLLRGQFFQEDQEWANVEDIEAITAFEHPLSPVLFEMKLLEATSDLDVSLFNKKHPAHNKIHECFISAYKVEESIARAMQSFLFATVSTKKAFVNDVIRQVAANTALEKQFIEKFGPQSR